LLADVLLRQEPDEEEDEEEDEGDGNGKDKEDVDDDDTTDDGYSECACPLYFSGGRMKREHFVELVEEALDSLPQEFRSRIRNVAVLVEDMPPNQPSLPQTGQQRRLLLGLFHGVPTTKKSIFDLPTGPDHIVLYQKEY